MPYQPIYGNDNAATSMVQQNAQMGQMWTKLLMAYMGQGAGAKVGTGAPPSYLTPQDQQAWMADNPAGATASASAGASTGGGFD